jgi:deoxycytidylate deaminase
MSLDLARQVGAVICTPYEEIVATGCAEVPKYGGGNYYTQHEEGRYWEHPKGRDIKYGRNPNKQRISELVDEILSYLEKEHGEIPKGLSKELLEKSPLKSLIEFMRSSHAESEAILSCARNGIPTRGCTMYCTTMPCHECGKRIVGAGIERVVFIEPYPKSKTLSQHSDSTFLGFEKVEGKVRFEPFVGVGPRKFIDLFSMQIGSGYPTERQDKKGYPYHFEPESAILRNSLYPISYLAMEERIISCLKWKVGKETVKFNFEEQSKTKKKP